ncbi:hypothetical protein L2E82_33448 [Cichorium intybus]|uniref:Uncharacterized protein n=1 Tax=Cichorium intybus TaxID=13427 RepID=A0ACB9BK80_CICIN|nr:hypothetical protein L1887_10303 [Cichorium endivia]KAI3722410.1 hypothetical protein L2E82_33448 [Cichorium intybus]
MVRLLSFLMAFTTTTLLFLFIQTGSGELILRSSKGVDHFSTTAASHSFHESREMMELDYEDAGPNTNKRSGFTQLPPSPEAPAPQV